MNLEKNEKERMPRKLSLKILLNEYVNALSLKLAINSGEIAAKKSFIESLDKAIGSINDELARRGFFFKKD